MRDLSGRRKSWRIIVDVYEFTCWIGGVGDSGRLKKNVDVMIKIQPFQMI